MLMHFRGVSGRTGIYLSGKPQQLVVFDDGLLTRQASGWLALAPLISPGQLLDRKVERETAGEPAGAAYAARAPRSQFTPLTEIITVELSRARIQHQLTITTTTSERVHRYQPAFAPDDQLIGLFTQLLGHRFVNQLPDH